MLVHPANAFSNAHTLVALSSGTDSAAALNLAVETYGSASVVAVTNLAVENGAVLSRQIPEQHFSRMIAKYYGVNHYFIKKTFFRPGFPTWSIYQWMPDVMFLALTYPAIERVWFGAHKGDRWHEGVVLWCEMFAKAMANHSRACTIDAPLKNASKKQQYNTLPDPVKQLVWTCIAENADTYTPCGACTKCIEFKGEINDAG